MTTPYNCVIAILLLLFSFQSYAQTITPDANNTIYVAQNVYGSDESGIDWDNAIPELSTALKWAREQYEADNNWPNGTALRIFVAKGTYYPHFNATDGEFDQDGDRFNSFVLIKDVQIYGGFDPDYGIADLTDNRVFSGPGSTILSGDFADDDNADDFSNHSENAYNVVLSMGDVGNALLDGVTIKGGNADGSDDDEFDVMGYSIIRTAGGGAYINRSSPTFKNVTFLNNTSMDAGGAIYLNNSSTNIIQSSFSKNQSTDGGAISISSNGVPVLTNLTIDNNYADRYGGGINIRNSSPVLTNIMINDNKAASMGGGLDIASSGASELRNITIANNSADNNAGGINFRNISSAKISNSIIFGNRVTGNINNIASSGSTNADFTNTLVEGDDDWQTAWGNNGEDNIVTTSDPFNDLSAGDYTLTDCSPAANKGNNNIYTDNGINLNDLTDLAGNPRVFDLSNSGIIDLGAYELQSAAASIEGFTFEGTTITYNGDPHTIEVTGLDASLSVSYVAKDADDQTITQIVNAGIYNITATITGCGTLDTTVTLTIDPAVLTVTPDNDKEKVYGDPDPDEFSYTITGFQKEEDKDDLTGKLSREGGEDVGDYNILIGDLNAGGNYIFDLKDASFEITRAPLKITARPGQSKIYGDPDPVFQFDADVLKNGDLMDIFSGSLSREEGIHVGKYELRQGDLNPGNNYTITEFISDNFEIKKATLTITARSGQGKVYGETDSPLTFNAEGFKYDDKTANLSGSLVREEGEDVGSYEIQLGDLRAGTNYNINFVKDYFKITKAVLSVTANSGQNKVYGTNDPAAFSYSATGFKRGDNKAVFTGKLSRNAGENVGVYNITIGTLSAGGNYTINLTSAGFTITKALLTVEVKPKQSKKYGDNDPVFTYTASGFIKEADKNSLTGKLGRESGKNVGLYSYNIGNLNGGLNYTIKLVASDKFEIKPAVLTITAKDSQTKIYGQEDPVLTYFVSGLKEGDNEGVVTGSLTRESGEDVGLYEIKAGNISAGANYSITFIKNNFEITKADITGIIFDDATFVYDALIKHIDIEGDLPEGTAVSYNNNDQVNAGQYTVTANIDGGRNYFDLALYATLTIGKATNLGRSIVINGTKYDNPEEAIYYSQDCGSLISNIPINIIMQNNAPIDGPTLINVATMKAGLYRQDVTISSPNIANPITYHITIERPFTADEILVQKFDNTLLVNNNPETNGGYKFIEYKWFKDGTPIGEGQVYSVGNTISDLLDEEARYSAILTTIEGDIIHVCPSVMKRKHDFSVMVYPNPSRSGGQLRVIMDYPSSVFNGAIATVSSLNGVVQLRTRLTDKKSLMQLPSRLAPGAYMLTVNIEGQIRTVKFIVK